MFTANPYLLSTSWDLVCSRMFRYMHLLTILVEAFIKLQRKERKETLVSLQAALKHHVRCWLCFGLLPEHLGNSLQAPQLSIFSQ